MKKCRQYGLFAGVLCLVYVQLAHAENELSNKGTERIISLPVAQTIIYERSYLTKVWNLDDQTFWDASQLNRIQPYRQTYLLVNTTSNPNRLPSTPTVNHSTLTPFDIDAQEAKFQFSLKADIGTQRHFDFIGLKTFRLWGAYTQQSNWQAFSLRNSSPIRETVYEPELIATLGTGNSAGFKLFNIGGVHQSNGRAVPESRSWNRVYVLGGWEWDDTTSVLLRRWQRIQESTLNDDNPDIIDYLGRGDLVIRWEPKEKTQSIAILLRNNLNKTDNCGYIQIDWATPVKLGHVGHLHIQMTSGYEERVVLDDWEKQALASPQWQRELCIDSGVISYNQLSKFAKNGQLLVISGFGEKSQEFVSKLLESKKPPEELKAPE